MKVIITGSTGMVGHAVLLECLEDNTVSEVLVLNRSKLDLDHPKLKELLIPDFSDLSRFAAKLNGYQACFHCMGISAMGLNEEEYSKITFGYSKELFDCLYKTNPEMTVTYVSGAGTDSTEEGSQMWARVKGKTENYMLKRGFKDAYAFRPGAILPEKGVKSKTKLYNLAYVLLRPFYPLMRKMKGITTSSAVGQAMLAVCANPESVKIIEPKDMNRIAKSHSNS